VGASVQKDYFQIKFITDDYFTNAQNITTIKNIIYIIYKHQSF